jgi:hypothetical protein
LVGHLDSEMTRSWTQSTAAHPFIERLLLNTEMRESICVGNIGC